MTMDLAGSPTGTTANQYSGTNSLSLIYDDTANTLEWIVNGQSRMKYSVDLANADANSLVIKTYMNDENEANVGIRLKNMTLDDGSAIHPIGDESSAWSVTGGRSDALIITGFDFQSSFTFSADFDAKYAVNITPPEMGISVQVAQADTNPDIVRVKTKNANGHLVEAPFVTGLYQINVAVGAPAVVSMSITTPADAPKNSRWQVVNRQNMRVQGHNDQVTFTFDTTGKASGTDHVIRVKDLDSLIEYDIRIHIN
jgi:hypothetical protein